MDTINELRGKTAPAAEEPVVAAPEPVKAAPAPPKAAPAPPAPKMTGGEYSVGDDVKIIQSVPNNKPPSAEDTIEGRYAGVLFTTASQ